MALTPIHHTITKPYPKASISEQIYGREENPDLEQCYHITLFIQYILALIA